MARPANSRILILFLVLAFMVPVSADLTNVTRVSPNASPTTGPAPYTIALFIPESTQIHSNQVTDLVSDPGGMWLSRHPSGCRPITGHGLHGT